MAHIFAGVGVSHVPAIGAALDQGKSEEPYWAPLFKGFERTKAWIAREQPDVIILIYNDHASAFSLEVIPTFAIGCAESFMPADEGWGRRNVPVVEGHPKLAWHMSETLILDEFDITIVNKMEVDHGLTVPLSLLFGQVDRWPCRIVPLAVNVIQYPPPTGHRCYMLGKAIRRAVASFPGDLKVAIAGTGGLSHQLQGPRAGLINKEWDQRFLDDLSRDPERLARIPHLDYVRQAGSEGIEMVMWLVMRGALDELVDEVYRFYHVPASSTAVGHIVLTNRDNAA
jgi:protocatechuate 4,5-dioxygenase beta chain